MHGHDTLSRCWEYKARGVEEFIADGPPLSKQDNMIKRT